MSLDASGATPHRTPPAEATGRGIDIPPRVARRAVEWLIALQSGEDAAGTRRGLQRWLDQHPDHERAWRHIEAVNDRLRGVASPVTSVVAHAALAPRRSVKRRDAVKTLACVLFAAGTVRVAGECTPWREWLADERTGVGQRRTVTLDDGSTLALNTDSAVSILFSAHERRVRLIRGEILVSTGKDAGHRAGNPRAARPFVVETVPGELQPLGTRFAARQLPDGCRLTVFEGAVAVRPHDGAGRTVQAGERAHFTRFAVDGPAPADDTVGAWADGMLVASGMRLADFLAEVSRYRPGHLGCDPAVAGLRVSGTYPLDDTDRILDTLRTTLAVRIRYVTRYWVTVQAARA
jgi:transmembrane sensor